MTKDELIQETGSYNYGAQRTPKTVPLNDIERMELAVLSKRYGIPKTHVIRFLIRKAAQETKK